MIDFLNAVNQSIKGNHTELSRERTATCANCIYKSIKKVPKMLKASMIEVEDYVCDLCNCPIATKVFAKKEKNICKKWLK